MLAYMLDTSICIHVLRNYPPELRERFNDLAEQLCISNITLADLHYGAEKSTRRDENLEAVEQFTARLEVLAFATRPLLAQARSVPCSSEQVGVRAPTT